MSPAVSVPPSLRDKTASDLLPLVYDQLKDLARSRMAAEKAQHTLQPTALVHEAFVRLEAAGVKFAGKSHFFKVAADAMRRVLIEHARSKVALKRGGGTIKRSAMNVLELATDADPADMLAFDEALDGLANEAPLAAEVVRLRFFAGLSVEETAEALSISERTANREWTFARAWLYRVLGQATGA